MTSSRPGRAHGRRLKRTRLADAVRRRSDVVSRPLGHRVNNPASCRVATRAGYPAEGVERAKLRYGDERFDVETHARLATDPAPEVVGLPVR